MSKPGTAAISAATALALTTRAASAAPGTTTRLDVDQTTTTSTKVVWDAYALWTFNPATALRVLANNLAPRDYTNSSVTDVAVAGATERTSVRSTGPSYVNWQLRLELKL